MKYLERISTIHIAQSMDELDPTDRQLLQQAKSAAKDAYAPYSRFHVGCALQLANGEIITGSNQENVAFPSGLCAERVAIFYAGARFPGVAIKRMAITAFSPTFEVHEPVLSCGACLQSIAEYEQRQTEPIHFVLSGASGEVYIAEGTSQFLPFQFKQDHLK